jgi:hypothetical protein
MEPSDSGQSNVPVEIDQLKFDRYMQEVRDNQNLAMGVMAGLAGAAIGALVWAAVTHYTGYQIGWMAVGIGFLVGLAIRHFGKGVDLSFGIAGAVLALVGCLAGNIFTYCIYIAKEEGVQVTEVVSQLDLRIAIEMVIDTFTPLDILFYGLALYYGYKYSFYRVPDEKLKEFVRPAGG